MVERWGMDVQTRHNEYVVRIILGNLTLLGYHEAVLLHLNVYKLRTKIS